MTEANGSRRELRSEAWFSGLNMFTFSHRSWNGRGYPPDVFDGRPVIGICNSWSELTTCNAHLRIVAEHVKRGVWEAGGLPLEFPTISLGEPFMNPTTMMFRNLMAMDVEESLRANPVDGVEGIRANALLDVHRHQVPEEHRGRLHQVLAERDRRELERQSARQEHAALDRLGEPAEVEVAVDELRPRVADTHDRPSRERVPRDSLRVHGGPVDEPRDVPAAEPPFTAKPAHGLQHPTGSGLAVRAARGDLLGVEAEPVHAADVPGMFDLQAAIHHDHETAAACNLGSLGADHPELEPQRIRTDGNRLLGDRRDSSRLAKDVDDVDVHRHVAERRIAGLAEHLGLARIHRDDAVAV